MNHRGQARPYHGNPGPLLKKRDDGSQQKHTEYRGLQTEAEKILSRQTRLEIPRIIDPNQLSRNPADDPGMKDYEQRNKAIAL